MRVKAKSVTIIAVLLVCALLLPALLPLSALASTTYPLQPSDTEVASALDYLRGEQGADGCISDFATSAWATMAIAAAAEDPHDWKVGGNPSIVDYLADNAGDATSVMDYERMILAIAAADEDPTDFGGVDFVALLEAAYDGTQIGDASLVNDDFWGVMALISAGESQSSQTIANTVAFIKSNQNGDGGWSWGVGQDSDVDDTAAAIMALIAAGESQGSTPIQNALAYIKSTQMDSGGFESWGATNSASDSWAIDAIVAAGQDPTSVSWESEDDNNPVDDLLTFQNPDGSFNWQSGTPSNKALMTSYAIPALLGQPYPVKVLEPEEGVSVHVRIEGQNATIWSGDVTVTDSTIIDDQGGSHYLPDPTALGAMDEASQAGGFTYVVQDTAYGLYLYSVNGEEPEGMSGWMYRVDYSSPMVGCADFILNQTTPPSPPHEEVLFYWGAWDAPPLKIAVDKTEVAVDEEFAATVTYYDDSTQTWAPLDEAIVHADVDYLTGPDGTVAISVDHDATLEVFAEKDGFIRSGKVTVTIGEGGGPDSQGEVTLGATIIPAISIEVEPSAIDFGELGPRDTSDPHPITITNAGAWTVLVTAEAIDDAENLFVAGLNLDGSLWDLFEATITRDNSQDTQATLTVPEDYAGIGEMAGTLIFWATEAP